MVDYEYEITGGPAFSQVHVNLGQGQGIRAEAGAMSHMDASIEVETSSGGILGGIKRMFSGESFFQNIFTGPGNITFANQLPGDLITLDVDENQGWVINRDGFVAGSPNLEISTKWGGLRSMFGGEGAFLTHVGIDEEKGGNGLLFAGGYGELQKLEVPAGEEYIVDTGIFFATEDETEFKTSKVGGMKSFFFGGEGLVMRFFGPCTVYTQSRAQSSLVNYIISRIPNN